MSRRPIRLRAPFLKRIAVNDTALDALDGFPFDLPLVRSRALEMAFEQPITIVIGENGIGKSTLLEAIADAAGFGPAGGSRDHVDADAATERYRDLDLASFGEESRAHRAKMLARAREDRLLTPALRFGWLPKVGQGFFFRAETFHRLARYLDEAAVAGLGPQLGPQHLKMSHAEGFIDFFARRFAAAGRSGRPHLFIFDEPESALSPQRQIEFMAMLCDLVGEGLTQIIIATHSPLLMAYPGAELRRITRASIEPVALREAGHFQLLASFFRDPEGFIAEHLEVAGRSDGEGTDPNGQDM